MCFSTVRIGDAFDCALLDPASGVVFSICSPCSIGQGEMRCKLLYGPSGLSTNKPAIDVHGTCVVEATIAQREQGEFIYGLGLEQPRRYAVDAT